MDKLRINEAFKMMHSELKSLVPPCVEEGNEVTHYAVWAEKNGEKHLFCAITQHTHSMTIEFNDKISEHDAKQLFSKYILEKMNKNGRLEVRIIENDMRRDIQDAIQNLMRYYTDKGWM
ncbi:MAG: hypothetical protein ACRCX4_11825 [Bacteroidales bacterium]